jgi:D-alanyl-lipoteichoic acid acyltransferase DltB (MBOAT superfamily)
MLFNSISFALFLPIVFFLYWFVMNKNLRSQNLLLLLASFIFYAVWDWRFLVLMVFSKSIDFVSAIQIEKSNSGSRRRNFLLLSIFINVSVLCFFKYFSFFAKNFSNVFSYFGSNTSSFTVNIILPVGLSFYTMQALAYVIDVYQEKVKPTHSLLNYFTFISFFPLILAGPIERASNLLNQLDKKRLFDYSNAVNGSRQILWGLLKKVAIADNCAQFANEIFNNSTNYSGSTLVLGALFFTIQIYCDFSGYSDIAIGIAKLFNINLMRNFAFPYFSRNIGEFWRNWHISLTSWLFDYIFKPLQLSFRNLKLFGTFSALFLTFIVSGVWHGSSSTFLVWGTLHTIYYLPSLFFRKKYFSGNVSAKRKFNISIKELLKISFTFCLIVFAWIFFRADSLEHALSYISGIFSDSLFMYPFFSGMSNAAPVVFLISIFIIIEWFGRKQQYAIEHLFDKWYKPLRWLMYYSIILAVFFFSGKEQQYIYFKF